MPYCPYLLQCLKDAPYGMADFIKDGISYGIPAVAAIASLFFSLRNYMQYIEKANQDAFDERYGDQLASGIQNTQTQLDRINTVFISSRQEMNDGDTWHESRMVIRAHPLNTSKMDAAWKAAAADLCREKIDFYTDLSDLMINCMTGLVQQPGASGVINRDSIEASEKLYNEALIKFQTLKEHVKKMRECYPKKSNLSF